MQTSYAPHVTRGPTHPFTGHCPKRANDVIRILSGSNWQRNTLPWDYLIHMQTASHVYNVILRICNIRHRLITPEHAEPVTTGIMRDYSTIG